MNTDSSSKTSLPFTEPPPPARPSQYRVALRELWKSPITAKLGILIVLSYLFVALFAPWLTPYGESEIVVYWSRKTGHFHLRHFKFNGR